MLQNNDPIETIVDRYRKEHRAPIGLLHFHSKNSDFTNHIKLLETAQELIKNKRSDFDKDLATLGILLIFRTLLIDPNRRNEVYNELIDKLKLDDVINTLLATHKRGLKVYYPDLSFLKVAKEAMEYAEIEVLGHKKMIEELSTSFIKDVNNVLTAEFEYLNEVMYTIKISNT